MYLPSVNERMRPSKSLRTGRLNLVEPVDESEDFNTEINSDISGALLRMAQGKKIKIASETRS